MSVKKPRYSRVNRPLAEAQSYYSRLSSIYDFLAASEKKFIKQGLDLLDPKDGEMILEIGSGTGYAQLHLVKMVGRGKVIGLDLSAGMCLVAQQNLIQAGLSSHYNLIQNGVKHINIVSGL